MGDLRELEDLDVARAVFRALLDVRDDWPPYTTIEELGRVLGDDPIRVVSIAAGVDIADVRRILGPPDVHVRTYTL